MNDRFDLDHYMNVHVPMGKGALWRYEQTKPVHSYLLLDTYGMDRRSESAPYHAIAVQFYETREEAEAFIRIFERPDVAIMIGADWPRYTDAEPVCVLGRVHESNVDKSIAESASVLRDAGAPE